MVTRRASIEHRYWLARVRAGPNLRISGAGFVIDQRHVLTCAHVAADAGATGPGDVVFVDFPLLRAGGWAEILREGWATETGTTGDTALLRLIEIPEGLASVQLRSLRSLDGHAFTSYGFPAGHDDSVPTEGRLGKAVGREWVKMEAATALVVQPGFSGAAVWSEEVGSVVAMVVTRDVASAGRIAFAIPVRVLADRCPTVAAALASPLDLDPDAATHWGPRSRGVAGDADAAGWLFTGRRRALIELVHWLTLRHPPSMRVVTGTPGSGKSALLSRVVTTADRGYRRRIPALIEHDMTVAPVGAFDVTFHASGRSVADLVTHVSTVTDVEAHAPGALLAAFDDAERWPVIAVDALDESIEPKAMARLLVDMAQRGARVLVATRDNLLGELDDPNPLRVDQSPYLETADVEDYVSALLAADGGSPGVDNTEVRDLVLAADGNFLVAQLVARALALGGDKTRPFPRQVHHAFERYLDALPDAQVARDLLLPLAYSFGDGLPADELWLMAVAALRRPYLRAELDDLLGSSAGPFLVTRVEADGGPRHRLFHLALTETLTTRRDRRTGQRAIWRAWTDGLPKDHLGRPRWSEAAPYLREHAPDHAAEAGLLAEVVQDATYLMVGDIERLLVRLGQHPSDDLAEHRAVLRLAARRLQGLEAPSRPVLLALAARHLGLSSIAEEIVTCAGPGLAPLWAHSLGYPNQPLAGHPGWVTSVALGRVAGRDVVLSCGGNSVRVWDATSGRPLGEPVVGRRGVMRSISFGKVNGREVVAAGGDDCSVGIWDASTGLALGNPLTGHSDIVRSVMLGQLDGRDVIVSGSADRTARIWDPLSGHSAGETLIGHAGAVNSVALGESGSRGYIVTSDDYKVRIWDASTGSTLHEAHTGHTGRVLAMALGRTAGRYVLVSGGSDGTVRLCETSTGMPIEGPLTGHTGWVTSVALGHVDGRDVVASAGTDGTVRLWDAANHSPLCEPFTGHANAVMSVALGSVGGRDVIVSGGDDRTIRVWDAATEGLFQAQLRGHDGAIRSVAFGRVRGLDVVVSGSDDHTVRIWNAMDGVPICEPLRGHQGPVISVALANVHGRDVVVSGGADSTVRLWDAATGRLSSELASPTPSALMSVALGRVGHSTVVAIGGHDRTVRLWDVDAGRLREPLRGHDRWVRAVVLGRLGDRDVLACGDGGGTVRLWDAATSQPMGLALTGHTGMVRSLALGKVASEDVVVSGGDDGLVRVWAVSECRLMGEALAGEGRVASVAIGQIQGRNVVVSGGDDGIVRLWAIGRDGLKQVESVALLQGVTALGCDKNGRLYVASGRSLSAFG